MQATIYNIKGESSGTVEISDNLVKPEIKTTLLHEVVVAQLANRRSGCADTKTRGEVRGGGKKPWKQKHTGQARAGSIRSPLWRKGGIIFGPHPRSYEQALPKQKFSLALLHALRSKFSTGAYSVLESLSIPEIKTKRIADFLARLKVPKKSLLVTDGVEEQVRKAARNLPWFKIKDVKKLHALDVLKAKKLLITQGALKDLEHLS